MVNDIAEATDAAVEAASDSQGNPQFTPDTRPEISPQQWPELVPIPYEVPWPDSFPQEFPDADPWIDPESNPWPDPVPDPGGDIDPDPDPDPEPDPDLDPDGGGYNNEDWDQKPPDRPKLKTPVLLGLFPFCIPFDIKKSIEWFGDTGTSENSSSSEVYNTGVYNDMTSAEVEEVNGNSGDPIYAIPLNLGVAGQQILQTVIVIDFTEYGLPTLVYYLKAVQLVLWVITLCWCTKKAIF